MLCRRCAYTDPQSEAAWNTFTIGKIAGAGLSARFSCPPSASARVQRGCPRYRRYTISAMPPSSTATPIAAMVGSFCPLAIGDRRLASPYVTDSRAGGGSDEVLLLSDTASARPAIVLQPGVWPPGIPAMPPSSRVTTHHRVTSAAVFIYQPITAGLRHPAEQA